MGQEEICVSAKNEHVFVCAFSTMFINSEYIMIYYEYIKC